MNGLRLLSETLPKVADKAFSRKYIMLGRLVTQWDDIVGADLAKRTQPVKIRYYKPKNQKEKPKASLDIACASAEAPRSRPWRASAKEPSPAKNNKRT